MPDDRVDAPYRCAILISAYGASPFLSDQVQSVVQQMGRNDVLVIVDDGSRRVPWSVIAAGLPRNYVLWSRPASLGATRSYLDLLVHCPVVAQCYFLADQDDVWLPRKLAIQWACVEKQGVAASTHAWVVVPYVGDERRPPPPRIDHPLDKRSAAHYCFETPAPGMTLALAEHARAYLVEQAGLLSDCPDVLPHDRLLFALLGQQFHIHLLPNVLVAYRQHESNVIGAPDSRPGRRLLSRLRRAGRSWQVLQAAVWLWHAMPRETRAAGQMLQVPLVQQVLRSNSLDNVLTRLLVRPIEWLARSRGRAPASPPGAQ